MTDFAESDLLALIEGDLAPKHAARLRQRLAGDPQMAALVERLQDDREMLRTMAEPPLPADLLVELEPMMARPMLLPDAGDWRRRYRPRRPWRRYIAFAAVVCMALLAGVWAVGGGLFGGGAVGDSMLAMQVPPTPDASREGGAVSLDESTPGDTLPPPGSTIHHRHPVGEATRLADAREPRRRVPPGPRHDRRAAPMLTAADFVLVVNAPDGDEQALQDILQRVVAGLDGDVALVRNFSFEQAQQLARRVEADQGRRLDHALSRASDDFAGIMATGRATGGERLVRRRKAASRLARRVDQSGGALAVSGQLVGPRSLAPTYEQQIDYAEGGAIWTISVPADRLNDVLAGLHLAEGCETVLQLRRDGDALPATGADRWLSDYPRILREAAQLNGTVLLPVMINHRPAAGPAANLRFFAAADPREISAVQVRDQHGHDRRDDQWRARHHQAIDRDRQRLFERIT